MSRTLRIIERARSDVDEIFNWLVKRRVYRSVFEFSDAEVLLLRVRGPGQPP